ncbi:dephospho-CoA kinase [Candidatus Gottesmanbacteria bacterium]|nr:dephospho-CoA kinase [Candidatus Gottesmanbacteria bacterium]
MSKSGVIIAIVGMPGSGKSIAAEYFRSQNIPVLRFGDQTDIGLAELKLARNEKNERWYRENIRKELGMAAMAIKIEPRIHACKKKQSLIVLDGLYSWEEYLYLKNKFPNLILLCLWSSKVVRYERLGIRAVRPLLISEAISRDIAEIEQLHKGGPIAMADYLIKNESDEMTLHSELARFLKTIR